MNYLAHAYLSFKDPDILTGNLISDFVKGKKKFDYPPRIQDGIRLHRLIDEFTDRHESTIEIKKIFSPVYRLYSGAFADVVYDHFLAKDLQEFPENQLYEFAEWVYATLDHYVEWMPERFRMMFPYMKQQNWLYHYRLKTGAERSFEGLVRRAAYLHDSRPAFQLLEKHYEELQYHYGQFFPSIKEYAKKELAVIQRN